MSPAAIPPQSAAFLLEEAAARDAALARRLALLRILLDERYLDRQQLMTRLSGITGPNCFGSAWEDVFYRDMRVVKAALSAAGYRLRYSRDPRCPGYYLAGQPALSDELRSTIRHSVTEIDRAQIGVFRRLTPAQRFRLGCSVTDTARDAVAYRLRQQNPQLSPIQASVQAVQGQPDLEEPMDNEPISYGAFVRLVLDALEAAGIEYLIGGAVAAWAWGEPRSTLDLDLVVNLPVEAVTALSKELEKRDMLVPPEIILDALIEERADVPINAIHKFSGFKANLYTLHAQDELRQSAFSRRMQVDFGPPIGSIYVHSPEDLIIYKTWYFSLSRQTKHLRDIAAITASSGDALDYTYLEAWITRRGLTTIWQGIVEAIRSGD